MRKAVIKDGVVINIIECTDAGIAGMRFPLGQMIWDCGQYAVSLGDSFKDGVFSRNGASLEPQPTEQDQIDELKRQLAQNDLAMAELAELMLGGAV